MKFEFNPNFRGRNSNLEKNEFNIPSPLPTGCPHSPVIVRAYLVTGAAPTTAPLGQQSVAGGGRLVGCKNSLGGIGIGYNSPEKYCSVPNTTQY